MKRVIKSFVVVFAGLNIPDHMENPYTQSEKKSGPTLVEYALILAIICIIAASIVVSLEERSRVLDTKISSTIRAP